MSYVEYIKADISHRQITRNFDDPGTLVNKNVLPKENEYYSILKRIYPDLEDLNAWSLLPKYCPLKEPGQRYVYTDSITHKDFTVLAPAYVFRGDDRSLLDIYRNGGFTAIAFRDKEHDPYGCGLDMNNLAAIKKEDGFWKFFKGYAKCSTDKVYLYTSRNFDIAKSYSNWSGKSKEGNVYALFTTQGIDCPTLLKNKNGKSAAYEETVIPVKADWEEVIGNRITNDDYLVGPVFLRKELVLKDVDNFWKILQLFGDKQQYENSIKYSIGKQANGYAKLYKNIFNRFYVGCASCEEYTKFIYGEDLDQQTLQAYCLNYKDESCDDTGLEDLMRSIIMLNLREI
jgi:hypothetical protein